MEDKRLEPFWYFLYCDYDDSGIQLKDTTINTSNKYSTYEECYTDWKNTFNKIGYPMMGYDLKEIEIPKVGS